MENEGKIPGIRDGEALFIEGEALAGQAQNPNLTDQERADLLAAADQAWMKIAFVEIRDNLLVNRLGLELPDPLEGETYHSYYERVCALADRYDEEREGE